MMVDGFPVCDECLEDFTGPWITTLDGRTCHWACLHACGDCGREFQEGQPRVKRAGGNGDEPRWVHARDDECIPL